MAKTSHLCFRFIDDIFIIIIHKLIIKLKVTITKYNFQVGQRILVRFQACFKRYSTILYVTSN